MHKSLKNPPKRQNQTCILTAAATSATTCCTACVVVAQTGTAWILQTTFNPETCLPMADMLRGATVRPHNQAVAGKVYRPIFCRLVLCSGALVSRIHCKGVSVHPDVVHAHLHLHVECQKTSLPGSNKIVLSQNRMYISAAAPRASDWLRPASTRVAGMQA